jgi:hypothetical protein
MIFPQLFNLPWTRQGQSPWNQPVGVCKHQADPFLPMTLRPP